MVKKTDEIWATGRRKCAVARVRIKAGTGKVVVNDKEMNEYFNSEALCGYVAQVLKASDSEGKVDIVAASSAAAWPVRPVRSVTVSPARW